MKKIAALTMVRNDEFFLRKWVGYYGPQLGKDNLYVFFDGLDQTVPPFCEGVNVRVVSHIEGNVRQGLCAAAHYRGVPAVFLELVADLGEGRVSGH